MRGAYMVKFLQSYRGLKKKRGFAPSAVSPCAFFSISVILRGFPFA